jgi:hypothetical protein
MRLGLTHLLTALEGDEIAELNARTGVSVRQPYFDPDLVHFLGRIRPERLCQGGRSKGLVREMVARRFPQLGFERQRKVTAARLFRERMKTEIYQRWSRLEGGLELARLGIVDESGVESFIESTRKGRGSARRLFAAWSVVNLETWLRNRSSGDY